MLKLIPLLGLLMAFAVDAGAHEVRPAYLQITETTTHGYDIVWKKPTFGETAVHLVPRVGAGWLDTAPAGVDAAPGYLLERWSIPPPVARSVNGTTVAVDGLENTITSVLVVVRFADGSRSRLILTPAHPAGVLRGVGPPVAGFFAFLRLGVEHILTGADHLVFVFALLLVIDDRWMLLKTISAFTLAHSITLAAAALGCLHAPLSYIDTMIALSILFLGPEIIRKNRGETSFTLRNPWIIAFAFGLLHGLGLAAGLSLSGLPRGELALALVSFNAGVELGQLAFVATVLILLRVLEAACIPRPRAIAQLPALTVGALGAFWTLERMMTLFE